MIVHTSLETSSKELDEAVSALNAEVRNLEKETEYLNDSSVRYPTDPETVGTAERENVSPPDCGAPDRDVKVDSLTNQTFEVNKNNFFDVNLYRESSRSPPPHPITTYRWEDIKREKEKVMSE